MTVPTPDFQDLNLSDGWTENGSPVYVNDLWNAGTAFLGDGDDSLQQAEIVPDNATPLLSYSIWFKTTTTSGAVIIGQEKREPSDAAIRGCFFLQMNGNGTLAPMFFTTSASNGVASSSTNAGPFYNDGNLHHALITGNGNDVNIFVDGAEVAYQSKDVVSGGGFASIVNTSQPLSIANQIGGASDLFFNGEVTRPKIWLQTEITTAQALEEFNNEEAERGGSLSIKLITILSSTF